MLLDLGRNDVGRVSTPGSVQVPPPPPFPPRGVSVQTCLAAAPLALLLERGFGVQVLHQTGGGGGGGGQAWRQGGRCRWRP